MIIRSIFLTLLSIVAIQGFVSGQAPQYADAGTLPKIIPPSPEVASIANIAQISNSKFTGSASASVPLYTVKHGSLTHPIELRYSTNGLKVAEMPSCVGMGWNLMAGGSISRVVHDEPDGESTYLTPPSNLQAENTDVLNYVTAANEVNNDTEFDEYSISAGGLSGKFFIDATGVARFTSHSNLKVTMGTSPGTHTSVFVVTATDGSKYYFGGFRNGAFLVERTDEVKANSKESKHKIMTTTWFLDKIVSPQGDVIRFDYAVKEVKAKLGAFQQVTFNAVGYLPNPDCDFCTVPLTIPSSEVNQIIYDSYYLTGISAGDVYVTFSYSGRGDNTGDKKLLGVSAVYSKSGTSYPIKQYSMEYEDNLTEGTTFKYYLQKVKQVAASSGLDPQEYTFAYNSGTLPEVESRAQDYLGYSLTSDGSLGSSAYFFPRPPGYAYWTNANLGTDRSPNFTTAKIGALKKITYPTGGYEEFEYEGHVLPEEQTNTTYTDVTLVTPGIVDNGSNNNGEKIVTQTLSPSSNQTVQLTMISEQNPAGPQNPATTLNNMVRVQVLKNGVTSVFVATLTDWTTAQHNVTLESGFTYQLKLTVWDINNAGRVYLSYNPVTTTETVNVDACGIRVKNIKSYDPVSDKSTYRYYKYAALNNQSLSSGVGTKTGNPFGLIRMGGWCIPPGSMGGSVLYPCEPTLQISSSSLSPIYLFNGSPVAYKYVLESNDPDFVNGVTEYEYYAAYGGTSGAIMYNDAIPTSPVSVSADMNGWDKKTIVYKKEGTSFVKQQETENEYSIDNRVSYYRSNYMIRKRFDPPYDDYDAFQKLKGFDIATYLLSSSWMHLDKTTTKTYDPDGLNPVIQVVDYTYGSETHMQPTSVSAQDSKSGTLVTDTKFPVDYPSTAPYTDMLARNMQTAPVETIIKRNATEQVKIKNNFYKWHDNGTDVVIAPSTVQTRTGTNSLEDKLVYESYAANGNLLQATGQDGVTVSFIWGYGGEYPVAKITGKNYADVLSESSINLTVVNNPASVAALRTELNKLYSLTGAFVTTSIYKPFIGVIQETDQRNRITYYEYDGFNRLSFIRDHDQNILKKFCYNYAGQAESCLEELNTDPDWQPTSELRCKPCPANASYITNMQQHEEVDSNPNSSTYNSTRWVDDNVAGSCVITPDWQNTATPPTCVQGSCGNTGYQNQEQKDMNPCSATYNTTQVAVINNPTACTVAASVTIYYDNMMPSGSSTGFTVTYTNTSTSQVFSFNIPGTGSGTLGCIPAGTYNVVMSKTGNVWQTLYGTGCSYQTGTTTVTFSSVTVGGSPNECNVVSIEIDSV